MNAPTGAAKAPQGQVKTVVKDDDSLMSDWLVRAIEKLEKTADKYVGALREKDLKNFHRALLTAQAVDELRSLFTPGVNKLLRSLMNTPLGFMTDRDPIRNSKVTSYSDEVIRDCAIESLLYDVGWTSNEFNIIAGRCYITQAGYGRKLRKTEGFTDWNEAPGIPVLHQGKVVVRVAQSCKVNGVVYELKDGEGKPGRAWAIKVNEYMGDDAIVGKAMRKSRKALFEQIHGSEHTPPDGDENEVPANVQRATETVADLNTKLSGAKEPATAVKELPAPSTQTSGAEPNLFDESGNPENTMAASRM